MVMPLTDAGQPRVSIADGDALQQNCDLLIFAIGYEARSTHAARRLSGQFSRGIGFRFNIHEELAFSDNLAWAAGQDAIDVRECDSEIAAGQIVYDAAVDPAIQRISVDVSSFPRPFIAAITAALWEAALHTGMELSSDFLYSVPEFSAPPTEHGPVVSFGAVHPNFVGSGAGGRGLATLIGLGYEPELALSAQQVLDPAETWLAVPRSMDPNFDAEVASANEVLLDVVDASNIWTYDIQSPATTFFELEAIVNGLTREHNVVLVPLGPKLFAVVCLLVSLVHGSEVGVWRLSAGGLRIPKNQIAAGPICTLSTRFSPGPRG